MNIRGVIAMNGQMRIRPAVWVWLTMVAVGLAGCGESNGPEPARPREPAPPAEGGARKEPLPGGGGAADREGRPPATGAREGRGILGGRAGGRERPSFKVPDPGIQSVAFSADGGTLALGEFDGPVTLWDVSTGKKRATLTGHFGPTLSVAFSPDGKTLASVPGDGYIV